MASVHGNHTMGIKLKLLQGDLGKPARGYIQGSLTGPRRYNPINGHPYREYPRRTALGAKRSQACLIIRRGPGKKTLRYLILLNGIPGRRPGLY